MSKFPEYMLAYFDTNHKKKEWYIIKYPFIIEYKDSNIIRGVFLRDIWFNYLINDKSNIHFMVIKIESMKQYLNILNNMNLNHHNINSNPSKNDFTQCISKHFILNNDLINKNINIMKDKRLNKLHITLYDNIDKFKLYIQYYNNEYTISIPSIELKIN